MNIRLWTIRRLLLWRGPGGEHWWRKTAKAGGAVVTLGPIIHNHHVVDRFQRMGVEVANSPEEVRPGSTVVLRAHGVPRQVEETLAGLPVQVVDATCPFVKRIHRLVQEAEARGSAPGGDHRHPHPPGGGGHCQLVPAGVWSLKARRSWQHGWAALPENFSRFADLSWFPKRPSPRQICGMLCVKIVKKQCVQTSEIFDTICEATENRQKEAAAHVRDLCNAMVVVGDANEFQYEAVLR